MKLLIVDALNYLHRAFHAVPPRQTKSGQQVAALEQFLRMLLKLPAEQGATHLCVVFDAEGETFRHRLYPEYKADRPPRPFELASQVTAARDCVDALGIASMSVPDVEADDVIGSLAVLAERDGLDVAIATTDKDLMALVDGKITLLGRSNAVVGPEEVRVKWGVEPRLVPDVLALMGDTTDHIPGAPGIGPKTAAELVNTFGSFEAVLEGVGSIRGKKGQTIVENREALVLSRALVELRLDVHLPVALSETRTKTHDPGRALPVLKRYELEGLLPAVPPQSLNAGEVNGDPDASGPSAPPADAAPAPTVAPSPGEPGGGPAADFPVSFSARVGDVLGWDQAECSVLLIHQSPEALAFFRANRGGKIEVKLRLVP